MVSFAAVIVQRFFTILQCTPEFRFTLFTLIVTSFLSVPDQLDRHVYDHRLPRLPYVDQTAEANVEFSFYNGIIT